MTQKGIAEKLGISITTVSRALRDLPDISNETKKAVLKLAKEGHYLPNTNALGLRKNETRRIGVIIPEIVHFFFSSTISGIMELPISMVILCSYPRPMNLMIGK